MPVPVQLSAQFHEMNSFATGGQAPRSEAAARVINWIAASNDNGSLPYMVIDKDAGTMFVFDAQAQSLGETPVLIGVAKGDDSSPGIGSLKLAEIGPAERTTPAGRFVSKFGYAAGGERVFWVKYADSVAMHAVATGNKKEERRLRLLTPAAEDNRITFGCINVPTNFYEAQIVTHFEENGGVVYVLPDTKSLEEVFPRIQIHRFSDAQSG